MRKACCVVSALVAAAVPAAVFVPGPAAAERDYTASLQARLDAGGTIYLPKLPDGRCYETQGLWVSRSGTTIASNGACVVYRGPGPTRLLSSDGDPIAANAVFIVSRMSTTAAPPEHVAISNLTLIVPVGENGYGVIVAGTEVTLADLRIDGVPTDAIMVTGRNNGLGHARKVTIRNNLIRGAKRNGVSIVGAVDVTIDGNTITGAGLVGMQNPERGPWAGIDIEPDVTTYPLKRITISRNTISGNGGSGVLLALVSGNGLPLTADQISLSGNAITFNGLKSGPFLRGGVCLQGGQSNGAGSLRVIANEIADNGGYGLCTDGTGFAMRIVLACNHVHDNADGDSQWGELRGVSHARTDGAARGAVGCG